MKAPCPLRLRLASKPRPGVPASDSATVRCPSSIRRHCHHKKIACGDRVCICRARNRSTYINAALHAPDAVILDLEDSVHRAEKDAARILVRNTLRAVDFGSCERMVRINQLPLGLDDLAEIVGESPDLILIPKVEQPEQVREVDRMIAEIKARNGIIRPIWIMPILESALGIENAFAVATASENVAGADDWT